MMMKHQSSTLEITIAAVIIASMLALSVVVLLTQEANAAVSTKFSFKQSQVNKCTDSAKCSHTGTITVGSGHHSPGVGEGGGHHSPGH